MMTILCSQCGKGVEKTKTGPRIDLVEGTPFLCSPACVLSYIEDFPNRSTCLPDTGKPRVSQASEVWDPITQHWFRSMPEMYVARMLHDNDIIYEYEKRTLLLKEGDMVYTPDFYLSEKDLFLEIKGQWLGSGKKKFTQAVKEGYTMILLPGHLASALRKEYHGDRGPERTLIR